MTINYTAMPTETLRFMLSQRHLNQSGPRRVLTTRLQESDPPATNAAPQVPEQLSAMIASIVEAKLANLNSSSTSGSVILPEVEHAQASLTQPTPTGAQKSRPSPRAISRSHSSSCAVLQWWTRWRTCCFSFRPQQSGRCRLHPQELQASFGGQPPLQQPDSDHHER